MSELGVGLVGYKFMGRTHSNAYRQVARFFDVDPTPRMTALAGRDADSVRSAAEELGWESYVTDYHDLLGRDDIQLIDVASPGYTHKEIVIAALEAGKHVLCEKPLANTLDEAQEMLTAARRAGTIAMVNFNYRRVPAVQLAKQLIDEGRLGDIRHFRANYLQDWIMDPQFPLVWRLRKELAGSGALGDIGAHIVDLGQFLVGEITDVIGMMETFIKERPVEATGEVGSGLSAHAGEEMGEVTVDDAVSFLARFGNGAMGSFNATRFAAGRRNANTFETNRTTLVLYGTKGTLRLPDPNTFGGPIELLRAGSDTWEPIELIDGYTDNSRGLGVSDLAQALREGRQPRASGQMGYHIVDVMHAALESSQEGRHITLDSTFEIPEPLAR
jgi:predicted dehydrogenase